MRDGITSAFWEYNDLCRQKLWSKYNCHQHWAKIEERLPSLPHSLHQSRYSTCCTQVPDQAEQLAFVRKRLQERFPLDEFNQLRQQFDPVR